MFQTNELILEDSKRRNVCNVLLCPAELCIFAGAKLGWSIQCGGSLAHYIIQAIMGQTTPKLKLAAFTTTQNVAKLI